MNTKGSLYAVIGGVVGAVLTLAVCSVMPIGAQSGDVTFGEITCASLIVQGEKGDAGIMLTTGPASGLVYMAGEPEYVMLSNKGISVFDGGQKVASIRTNELGGMVIVGGKDGEKSAQMNVDEHGGLVGVFGKGNKYSRAVMGVSEYGSGAVSTWDKNSYQLATLK